VAIVDQLIIQKVLEGDKESFGQLIEKYETQILAYCARLLNFNQENAKDVAANTFMKVYINLASYNPKLQFSSWLYRIAHNEAVNFIKQNSKHFSIDWEQNEHIGITNLDFDKPNKMDLEKILSKLKPKEKNLLVLFYLEEKSIKEIAEILKTSESSVKSMLSYARNKAKSLVKNP
jgi:RNA polymerase sigma-70 factor, ECF subfamily